MWRGPALIILYLNLLIPASAQDSDSIPDYRQPARIYMPRDADTSYIARFNKPNEARVFFGTHRSTLEYGSRRQFNPGIKASDFDNGSDFIGFGFTYKIADLDLSFALPKSRLLSSGDKDLDQFGFSFSYSLRKISFRAFIADIKGVVASDPGDNFESKPAVHQFRMGVQATYNFNNQRYSTRAANSQSELQRKSAGSFMLRGELFFRSLGAGSELVPPNYDSPDVYGEQDGLAYLRAPGLLAMPGYGYTFVIDKGKYFIAPQFFAGPGLAFNFFKGTRGRFSGVNWEFASMAALAIGYNQPRLYTTFKFGGEASYTPINPAYFSGTNIRMSLTLGYRLGNLEKIIPESLF